MYQDFESELNWAMRHMPRTRRRWRRCRTCTGAAGVQYAPDLKMAPLVAGLLDKGAAIFLTTCNPTTVQNDVVARLERRGAQAYARRDMSAGEWSESFDRALARSRLTCAKWGGFDHPLAPIAERPADRRRAGSHRIGHQPFERRGAALPDLQLGRSAGERGAAQSAYGWADRPAHLLPDHPSDAARKARAGDRLRPGRAGDGGGGRGLRRP